MLTRIACTSVGDDCKRMRDQEAIRAKGRAGGYSRSGKFLVGPPP